MQPVRLLLTLLGGAAAMAMLGAFATRRSPIAMPSLMPVRRKVSLPLHYNRLAAYYQPCVN